VPWDERFRQDIWYVDHQCFWLDVKILALTLWKVVRRDDIADPNVHDYSEFPGNATSGPPVQVKDNKPE
jgi:hypothetical protein